MTRKRPRGDLPDIPDDSTFLTQIMRAVPPWNGRTEPLPALPPVPVVHHTYAPPPPLTVVSVTVGDGTGLGADRLHAALTYIRLKAHILEAAGHGDRIDHAEHARRRGDPLPPRSAVGEICREASFLLRGTAGVR